MRKPLLTVVPNTPAKPDYSKLARDSVTGSYEQNAIDPYKPLADALMQDIAGGKLFKKLHFFSRDTLVIALRNTPLWGDVTSVTRYHYISNALRVLTYSGRLYRINFTTYCLPRYKDECEIIFGRSRQERGKEMANAVLGAARVMARRHGGVVSIQALLDAWENGNHAALREAIGNDSASRDEMRKLLRIVFTRLVRDGQASVITPGRYSIAPK